MTIWKTIVEDFNANIVSVQVHRLMAIDFAQLVDSSWKERVFCLILNCGVVRYILVRLNHYMFIVISDFCEFQQFCA